MILMMSLLFIALFIYNVIDCIDNWTDKKTFIFDKISTAVTGAVTVAAILAIVKVIVKSLL